MTEKEADRGVHEIRMDPGEDNPQKAWLDAISELEGHRPVKKKQSPSNQQAPQPVSHENETVVANDLTGTELLERSILKTKRAKEMLADFRRDHAYLIAPNIFDMWDAHLQETLVLLDRESERIKREEQ